MYLHTQFSHKCLRVSYAAITAVLVGRRRRCLFFIFVFCVAERSSFAQVPESPDNNLREQQLEAITEANDGRTERSRGVAQLGSRACLGAGGWGYSS